MAAAGHEGNQRHVGVKIGGCDDDPIAGHREGFGILMKRHQHIGHEFKSAGIGGEFFVVEEGENEFAGIERLGGAPHFDKQFEQMLAMFDAIRLLTDQELERGHGFAEMPAGFFQFAGGDIAFESLHIAGIATVGDVTAEISTEQESGLFVLTGPGCGDAVALPSFGPPIEEDLCAEV